MRFTSTRNKDLNKSFIQAVLDCMPVDGGLYVPEGNADLRRWILYTNEKTTFSSVAGALTLACINDEYSPIICETIATKAFPFEPVLSRLDDNLFKLDLYHGPTGCHRDFGVSYLTAGLETILEMENKKAVFLDVSTGEHGAILSAELRGNKNIKAVLLYPKGKVRGLKDEDLFWNGGNVYPVEVDGDESTCHQFVREIFADHSLVEKFNLTVSNTANIGRLIPQAFFYTYAFSRLKNKVCGDIYYALDPGNYSNLVAGLYSWRLSLPLSGFIVPATKELAADPRGYPEITDSLVAMKDRPASDPADPSNIERLEDFFADYSAMMKSFVYPAEVSEAERDSAAKELYKKYGLYADPHTANAYAAALKRSEFVDEDGGAIVLVGRDHPAYSKDYIQHTLGETIEVPQRIADIMIPTPLSKPMVGTKGEIINIIDAVRSSM